MNILTRIFVSSSLCFFLMSSSGYSETERIRVVYTDWFPYTYEENGEALGFEIEIFREVIKKMNLEADFVRFPWKRCLNSLEEGTADALISLLKTPEREKYTYFPEESISISRTVFFTEKDRRIEYYGSYDLLRGYTVGVIMGFSYGHEFDNADYLFKDPARDAQTLITMLLKGRHDLAAENQAVVNGYAMKMGVSDKIRFLEPPIHSQKLYAGFSRRKGLKKLCDDFSGSLFEFKKTETYSNILKKYGISPSQMADN